MFDLVQNLYVKYWVFALPFSFVLGFTTDWVWAKYTRCAAEGKAFAASNWSFLVYCTSAFYFIMLLEKKIWLIAIYFLGGYLGTYLGVRSKISKKEA